MNDEFRINDTRITQAGVMRCCLASVAEEYITASIADEKSRVKIGNNSKCKYCNTTFTLVKENYKPIWKPDWQLNENIVKV